MQFMNQAGFTRNKSTREHIVRLWDLINDARKNNKPLFIGGLDIQGAYDGVSHSYLKQKFDVWRKSAIFDRVTMN